MNKFGLRLKALIEQKGLSVEQFWPAFGISRATMYNWLKREEPPPSKQHQDNLVKFFGMSRSYVLFGRPEKLDLSKTTAGSDGPAAPQREVTALLGQLEDYFCNLSTRPMARRVGWVGYLSNCAHKCAHRSTGPKKRQPTQTNTLCDFPLRLSSSPRPRRI